MIKIIVWFRSQPTLTVILSARGFLGNLLRIVKPQNKGKTYSDLEYSIGNTRERMLRHSMLGMALSTGPGKHLETHNMNYKRRPLPGKVARSGDKGPVTDPVVNNAFDHTGDTYEFYFRSYGRSSIDNNGMPLISCVHVGKDWNNAQWDGQYMEFGDGDDKFFVRGNLTDRVVCAHELTHGVTGATIGLEYFDEMGGLNESISDVFGVMCEQWVKKQKADDASWLIGENIIVGGGSLRSMKDPGKAFPGDAQISNYKDFDTSMDPHISSGIANKAFYLACKEIGGYSWETAGKAW